LRSSDAVRQQAPGLFLRVPHGSASPLRHEDHHHGRLNRRSIAIGLCVGVSFQWHFHPSYRSVRLTSRTRSSRSLVALALTAGLVEISACSAPGGGLPLFPGMFGTTESPPETKGNDTCPTPEKCAAQLKILISDPVRDWVGRPQSPDGYTDGTRLFAYRALRRKLTCDELGRAVAEIETAAPSLQAAQYDATRKLMSDVRHELGAERTRRCRRS
jgi:hypothetical protein